MRLRYVIDIAFDHDLDRSAAALTHAGYFFRERAGQPKMPHHDRPQLADQIARELNRLLELFREPLQARAQSLIGALRTQQPVALHLHCRERTDDLVMQLARKRLALRIVRFIHPRQQPPELLQSLKLESAQGGRTAGFVVHGSIRTSSLRDGRLVYSARLLNLPRPHAGCK